MAIPFDPRFGERRPRPRSRSLVLGLLLLAITLTVIDRTTDGPLDFATDYVRDGLGSVGELLPGSSSSELERENQQLRNELERARNQVAQASDAQRERETLARMLVLPTPENTTKVAARVTSIGGSNFESSIEIGKGTNDGVAVGMPVMSNDGFVGRVVETSASRSIVLLLTDTTSSVAVRFASTGEVGVATGEGNGKAPTVDLIDLDSQLKVGDFAVTSGLQNSLFPPGIPVGRVVSSEASQQDLRRSVELSPLVDMNRLDTVAVLQWERP